MDLHKFVKYAPLLKLCSAKGASKTKRNLGTFASKCSLSEEIYRLKTMIS